MLVFWMLLALSACLWCLSGIVALLSIVRVGNEVYARLEYYYKLSESHGHTAEGAHPFIKKLELENEYHFALQLLHEKEHRPYYFYTVTLFRAMLIGPLFYSTEKPVQP